MEGPKLQIFLWKKVVALDFVTISIRISASNALIQSANQHSHMAFFGLGNG